MNNLLNILHTVLVSYRHIFIKAIILGLMLMLIQCMPIRRQMFLKDSKRKTLKQHRMIDTTVSMPPFKYLLQPGDFVSINFVSVISNEYDMGKISNIQNNQQNSIGSLALQNHFKINDTGYVNVPVLGLIKIGGTTIKEAEVLVQQQANKFLNNIIIKMRIESFIIYTIGELLKPGPIISPKDKLTITEAIALSGGFTDMGNRERIKIIRNTQENKIHIYYVDFSKLDLLTSDKIYLMPNDILVVEPHRVKNLKTYTLQNITLAISTISFILLLIANARLFVN